MVRGCLDRFKEEIISVYIGVMGLYVWRHCMELAWTMTPLLVVIRCLCLGLHKLWEMSRSRREVCRTIGIPVDALTQ